MHKSPAELQHSHHFTLDNRNSGRAIGIVIVINALVMVAEIVAGTLFGSMALIADGWHMGTHILALGITLVAYQLARKHIQDTRFAFGTWKIEILGSFTSAILLGVVAVSMVAASIDRILHPVTIHYNEALLVAVIGFVVNIAGALIISRGGAEHHHHDHHGDHDHAHHHHDLNMRAAYLHILTDAVTSLLAIIALCAAKYYSWNAIDPAVGIIGAVLIFKWTIGLLAESGGILLDREEDATVSTFIRQAIESDATSQVSDLHVWKIAGDKYACIIVLLTKKDTFTIADFKARLTKNDHLAHVTIELHYLS